MRLLPQRLSARFVVVLLLLGVLGVTTLVLLLWRMRLQEQGASFARTCAQFRQLAQRVAFGSQQLAFTSQPAERDSLSRSLRGTVPRLERAYQALVSHPALLDAPARVDPKLQAIFLSPPIKLDAQVRDFIAQARVLASLDEGALAANNAQLRYFLSVAPAQLFNGLDTLLGQFQADHDAAIARLEQGQMVCVALLLVVVTLVVVRPLLRTEEQQLRELLDSQRRLGDLLDTLGEAFLLTDSESAIVLANRAVERLWGYTEEELRGNKLLMLASARGAGAQNPLASASGKVALGSLHGQRLELTGLRKNAGVFPMEVRVAERRVGDRAFYAVIVRDLTERKRVEAELAKARDEALESARLKSQFLASMSHEIRTPMNGVLGMTGLLLDTPLSAQQRQYTETIRTSATALLNILNDILDFSRIEAGKLAFETVDFDLRQVVEGTVELLAEKADARHLELVCLVYHDVQTLVRGDPSRLRQVLTNLLDNAIKFTDRGDVLVRVSQEAETESHVHIRVAVSDTGVGLSAEAQRHLFLPFYQAEETTGRRQSGTGLGLAICKQIVEQMGGRIGAESAPGKGSTFWFTVPLEKQSAADRAPAKDGALAYLKLLIIDGNEASRHALQYETASWGMRADAVSAGVEGLEQLRRQAATADPYEVVLVDTNLADLDALGLSRAVKHDAALTHTKVVLLTTMNQRYDAPTLQAAGVEACLVKPIRHSQLYECLVRLLSDRKRQAAGAEPAPADAPAPAASALATAAASLRILLAEDNAINQKVAVGLLGKLHCRCDVVENGRQVLDALERTPYDVILMDCQIPLLDGYRTTMEIRRREAEKKAAGASRAYIIAITAHAMRGAREKCLAAGMDDYISKPVRLAELEAALERAVDFLNRSAVPDLKPETTTPVDHTALAAVRELRRADRPDPLTELITTFLRDTPTRLRDIREALARHDLPTAELLAKQLSDDAGHLGAQKIAGLGSQLASVAREGALALAGALAAEMEVEFQSVRAALEAEKAR